ncbi:SDR family NAD(P)-dependent oxidoreductase [Neobacillus sp. YIM B06451]|uniref:SDR family NAD(P)-dependent oxidoreductase n=1 Tax=Neobacillus sp. YIM B06451 TaxID=3070994 RepID=UPI00292EE5A5|nr:SDR family NAD(P)-dependent oxidoreductase [Neobacillus sp. YIM B06451]
MNLVFKLKRSNFTKDLLLYGKNVLITGGSKGIGKAIAKAFVAEGANVAISVRGKEALEQTKGELQGYVSIFQADITEPEERKRLITSC